MLQLYDSFARIKKEFKPYDKSNVKLYVCGITPNNATHLGHAFTYVSFDVLVRLLKHNGFGVTYVQNATDINDSDDVIKQANESGKSWSEIAQHWIAHFQNQMDTLGVRRPDKYILASSMMSKIVEMNQTLIDKGFAYESNGNVYFDVSNFKNYGALSGYREGQMLMISSERGNDPKDPNKKNPLDFVLWINSKGEPNWKSPWGLGRPGWHIECSAMIKDSLGDQIDIHGGGRDLIFPHHESELAQMEGATEKKPFVKNWMHVGMVMYEGEKMSKSLGNLILVEDLLKNHSPNQIRWLLLSHHYRHPWEYDELEFDENCETLKILSKKLEEEDSGDWTVIENMLSNDLNTPDVLRYLVAGCSGATLKKGLDLLGFQF